jgi:hypothetical protein
MNFREEDAVRALLPKAHEQLPQAGASTLDARAKRQNLDRLLTPNVEDVGLDLLVGSDGDP